MVEQLLQSLRRSIRVDIGLSSERHRMQPAKLDDLHIGIDWLCKLYGYICLKSQDVGRLHRATQIHQQFRMSALEFGQPRCKPERSKSFGDSQPNLAGERRDRTIARTYQAK